MHCDPCGRRLAEQLDSPIVDEVWSRLAVDLVAPRTSLVERLLARLGASSRDALLVWTAPAFRSSWLAAALVTLGFALWAAAASETRGLSLFLLVAPLLPVAGVALAYGPEADPVHELSVAAPYSSLRLLLLRTLAVLATTAPLTVVAGALAPGATAVPAAWLLPGLACVATTLAASTWVGVSRAAVGVAVAWFVVVVGLAGGPASGTPVRALDPPALLAYALLAPVAAAVLWTRSHRVHQIGAHR